MSQDSVKPNLVAELAKLKEALEFYADADNWKRSERINGIKYDGTIEDDYGPDEFSMCCYVAGHRARTALGKKYIE